MSKFRSTFKP